MSNIPPAKPSPRIENDGSLRWYYKDTFKLEILIKLIADDGSQIPLEDGDTILINFHTRAGITIYEFEFHEFEDNTVTLDFTDEVSALFKNGSYQYDAIHIHNYRRTVAHENLVVVE